MSEAPEAPRTPFMTQYLGVGGIMSKEPSPLKDHPHTTHTHTNIALYIVDFINIGLGTCLLDW